MNYYGGFFVPRAGLEPARQKRHRILSPACLPVPPPGQVINLFKNKSLTGKEGIWSERRDSNSRPRPWQGRALPTELLSLVQNLVFVLVVTTFCFFGRRKGIIINLFCQLF